MLLQILIYRGQNGFGFSISGQDPVVVCRVDSGSMAQIAGLGINDRILRIDGHNVARSNSEHVASLVRCVKNLFRFRFVQHKTFSYTYSGTVRSRTLLHRPPDYVGV